MQICPFSPFWNSHFSHSLLQTYKSDLWSIYLLHLKDKQIFSKTDDAIRTEIAHEEIFPPQMRFEMHSFGQQKPVCYQLSYADPLLFKLTSSPLFYEQL